MDSAFISNLKSLRDYGIVVGGNGDWGVTTGNPLVGISTAITRKTVTGEVVGDFQRVSVMDAVKMYTVNGAFLAFEEDVKGSLESGKLGDMVVLNRDIFTIPPEEIKSVKVDVTIVDGEVKYQRNM